MHRSAACALGVRNLCEALLRGLSRARWCLASGPLRVMALVPGDDLSGPVNRLSGSAVNVEAARIAEKFRFVAEQPQGGVELLTLADWDADVALPMDHEHRRCDLWQVGEW